MHSINDALRRSHTCDWVASVITNKDFEEKLETNFVRCDPYSILDKWDVVLNLVIKMLTSCDPFSDPHTDLALSSCGLFSDPDTDL